MFSVVAFSVLNSVWIASSSLETQLFFYFAKLFIPFAAAVDLANANPALVVCCDDAKFLTLSHLRRASIKLFTRASLSWEAR